MREIVFDPGHGGHDPGAVANGIVEKEYQLELALATRDRVLDLYDDVQIIMTRTTDVPLGPTLAEDLQARCDIVMARPNRALISFHHNAAGDPLIRGAEIYIYGPNSWWPAVQPDGAINYDAPNSYRLAALMEPLYREVMAKYDIPYRGIRTGNFHVLREIEAPGILLESFYATNPQDAQIAGQPPFKADLVEAQARMIGAAFDLALRAPGVGILAPSVLPPSQWVLPLVKVVLPDGRELWGEMRDSRTWIRIPGTAVDAPLRELAELMDREISWCERPPTARLMERVAVRG